MFCDVKKYIKLVGIISDLFYYNCVMNASINLKATDRKGVYSTYNYFPYKSFRILHHI